MRLLRKTFLVLLMAVLIWIGGASITETMLEVVGGRTVAATWLVVVETLLLGLTAWLWSGQRGGE